jgi:hypothetical protein
VLVGLQFAQQQDYPARGAALSRNARQRARRDRSAARSGTWGHARLDQFTGHTDLNTLTVKGEVVTDEPHPVVGLRVVPRAVSHSRDAEVGRLALVRTVGMRRGNLSSSAGTSPRGT